MKIALIGGFYRYGSTGKGIMKNYERIKNAGHEAKIFYGKKKQDEENPDIVYFGNRFVYYSSVILGRITGLSDILSNHTTTKLIRHLKKYQPDVVWLSGIHGWYVNWYRLIQYLKKNEIWTVYGMTDEFAFMGKCNSSFECERYQIGCGKCPHLRHYQESYLFDNSRFVFNLKKKAYEGWDKVIFRSAPYVVEKAKNSLLLQGKQFSITDSSVNVDIFSPCDTTALREKLGIRNDQKVMLLCAPFTDPHKGAEYFLDCARKCEKDNIAFVHVAFNGDKSILPSNYIPISFVKDPALLATYYSMADAYLCTSVSDAQPNACLEALACGSPIIGFNISGVPFIAPNECGTFVEPLNTDALAEAVRNAPRRTEESARRCREYALSRFSLEATAKRHAEFIAEVCALAQNDKKESTK